MPAISTIEITTNPRITLLEGFLTNAECDHLIHLASSLLQPSLVYTEVPNELVSNGQARNSTGTFLGIAQTPVLAEIERRIASLVDRPTEYQENMQVLNYQSGQYYQPHIDFFSVSSPSCQEVLAQGGQRIATCLLYLNTPDDGGETHFLRTGLKVVPIRGNAVLFYNVLPSGDEDWRSMHASLPVITGEKWVATKWIRSKPQR